MYETEQKPDKTIIIAAAIKGTNRDTVNDNLQELKLLCETAGCDVVLKMTQELPKINKATCIGSGKIEELKNIIIEKDIKIIVFDDELSPMQNRNLTKELKIRVMDRSEIIIDIFAKHAKSQEAKTQVEVAHLQYMLPRLTRLWTHLSKQYGGVGTYAKGPGETQIETDRRLVRNRIQFLKEKLKEIEVQKHTQRKGRDELTRFALVGYTNAGKSTLMKALTQSDVYIEDQLFATLDTTVRVFELPSREKALLSDTVGFIHKLPTHLIASFRSTLAEVQECEFIVHVIDTSHPNFMNHIQVVDNTLAHLGITKQPIIHVFNKLDLLEEYYILERLEKEFANSIFISAKNNLNIDKLLDKFTELNSNLSKIIELFIPYSKMNLINKVYNYSEVIERQDTDSGIALKLKVKTEHLDLFKNIYSEFYNKK
ncbi:GTPase HflX [bioreactor metagenome]|uniref:GTPase HflX n=1 Tax=bioreactor metagenome TaxID=1076179 RepID=A0A645BC73_9ZZZZ